MSNYKKLVCLSIAFAGSILVLQTANAAVSAEKAKALGTNLTRFGAIKAGSKDGAIPPYEGGLKNPPPVGKNNYPDPFADEKPLFTITKSNVQKYESELSAGTVALLKRLPGYKINVYPTHRTMSYPDWFLKNTIKNATTAKTGGKVIGDTVTGAAPDGLPYQGVPFPIPQNGYQVMWNNYMRYSAPVSRHRDTNWVVDASGNKTPLPGTDSAYVHPWSEKSGELRKKTYDAVYGFWSKLTSPPTSAGIQFLTYYLPDLTDTSKVWFYTPGQRRVRRAPAFTYDTPVGSYDGVFLWDEMFGYSGRMNRFNFKIVGRKEMIVPYNDFELTNDTVSTQVLGKKYIKPKYMRWERRRVWVVKATRKPDARHAYSKRIFLFDEDSWTLIGAESYDDDGNIWRVAQIPTFPTWDTGGVNNDTWVFYDLRKGNYLILNAGRAEPGNYVRSYKNAKQVDVPLNPRALQASAFR